METTVDCFVIMPINNLEIEPLWKEVYQPAIEFTGFIPRRIDKEDDGTPLLDQIIHFLNNSSLLIADLTFERPNCYFEVGFVMGKDRYNNLILCCRDDHNLHSPKYSPRGYKVHFDIQSFNVLWWDKDNLKEFKKKLIETIKRRKGSVTKPIPIPQHIPSKLQSDTLDNLLNKAHKEMRNWKRMS